MKIITSISDMRSFVAEARSEGLRLGFVPTMGYLHEGHLSLIRRAASISDISVVSIFVNPTQFGPEEDLDKYPRDMDRDLALCEGEKVDVVFCPTADEMYSTTATVHVAESTLSKGLCGASRQGHFAGVLTVVAKLFNVVQPAVALFGQKDAQQVRLIQQMVRDLDFPVEIIVGDTVREADGLAMSSRNAYLSDEERDKATTIYCALQTSAKLFQNGATDAEKIIQEMKSLLDPAFSLEYIEIVDWETLLPVREIKKKVLVAVAARMGATRLIDNIMIDPAES